MVVLWGVGVAVRASGRTWGGGVEEAAYLHSERTAEFLSGIPMFPLILAVCSSSEKSDSGTSG